MIVETINHQNPHSKTWIKSIEIDTESIKMDIPKNPEKEVIKVDKSDNTNRSN